MSYIFSHFWPYFLGAFGLGLLVGIITWMRNAQGVWHSGWLRWALLLFAAGVIAAFFRLFVGRGGVYLETALWMFGFYIAGCWLGGVLRTLFAAPESRFSGHESATTTGSGEPAPSAAASGTPAAFASAGATGSVAGKPGEPGRAAGASSEPGSATGPAPGAASLAPAATKGPGGAGDGSGVSRSAPATTAGSGSSAGIAAGVATGVAAASGSGSGPANLSGKAADESSVRVAGGREEGADQQDADPLDARQAQAGPTGAGLASSSVAAAAGAGTGQIPSGEAAPGEAGPDGELYAGTRPSALPAPRTGKADDLKRIRGIGRQNERKLNDLGIFHFDQIAAWSEDEVEWVGGYLAFPGRIGREDWVGQAGQLARGMETEFSRRVDSGDVPTSQKDG